jgi:multidrug efflux pump subunit AcrB
MVIAVVGYRSQGVLTENANRLKDELLALPGVSTLALRGQRRPAMRIRFDPVRLSRHGLATDTVVARLRQASVRIPAGDIRAGKVLTRLEIESEPKTASEIAKLPVGASRDNDGTTRTIVLGDVAEVQDASLTVRERFLQDGQPAVGIEVRFRDDADATRLGEQIRATLRAFEPRLDSGVQVRVAYDQPEWVVYALRNFTESLLEGILLVMGVVTLGLGLRSSFAVAAAIPLAIGGALVGLFSLGFALEQVSIAALIVALGLLVDDAVVVIESIQLMRDRGLSSVRGAVLGTARVFWANNVTTAVACASFLPFFFMGGDIGKFVRGLPTAVVLALATSLIVAQVVTPWLSSRILRQKSKAQPIADDLPFHPSQDTGDDAHHERNLLLKPLKWLYARVVPVIVRRPWLVVGGGHAALGGRALPLSQDRAAVFSKGRQAVRVRQYRASPWHGGSADLPDRVSCPQGLAQAPFRQGDLGRDWRRLSSDFHRASHPLCKHRRGGRVGSTGSRILVAAGDETDCADTGRIPGRPKPRRGTVLRSPGASPNHGSSDGRRL